MWLALKAQHSPQAWGIAPGPRVPKASALKARFTSATVETRFQRFFRGHLNSWGDALGSYETAPLAQTDT
jgi:hypothetical protein